MIRIFKIFIFFSFVISLHGQSEYIYVLGNVQDAGLPHIGCKHEFCKEKFNEFEEYFTTSIAVIDPLSNKYILFEATPDLPYQLNYLDKKICMKRATLLLHGYGTEGLEGHGPSLFEEIVINYM